MPKKKTGITEKTFIILAQEAIECISIEEARATYKSIKAKTNAIYSSFKPIEKKLSDKVALNEQIEELEEEIDDNPSDQELQDELDQLLCSTHTISLIRDLEKTFNVKPKTFATISDSKVKITQHIMDKKDTNDDHSDENDQELELEQKKPHNKAKKKSKAISPKKSAKTKKKSRKKSDSDDSEYDNLAVYQNEVYNNKQLMLSKRKKSASKSRKKAKKKEKVMKLHMDNVDMSVYNSDKVFTHSHEKQAKIIKADSKKWDRDWGKIHKQRDEIKKIKRKRKDSNSLKIRNQKSTAKIYANPHSKNAKASKADSSKWDRDWDKIQKQRAEIKRIKEKRKKEKENKMNGRGGNRKRTSSFRHPHDKY